MIECAEPNWVTIGFENGMSIRVWVVCVVKASALMPGDKWAIGLQAQGARMHEWICAGADIDSEAMIKIEHTRATATGFVCWNSLIDVVWMQVYSPLLPAAHSRTPHALRGRFLLLSGLVVSFSAIATIPKSFVTLNMCHCRCCRDCNILTECCSSNRTTTKSDTHQ